jgi:hypothetical protein
MRSTDLTNARPTGITAEQPAPQKPGTSRPARRRLFLVVVVVLAALLIGLWRMPAQTEREVTDAVVEALRNEGKRKVAEEAEDAGFTWDADSQLWECRGRGFSISYHPATRRINVMIFYPAGRTEDAGTLRRTPTGKWAVTWEKREHIRH